MTLAEGPGEGLAEGLVVDLVEAALASSGLDYMDRLQEEEAAVSPWEHTAPVLAEAAQLVAVIELMFG